MTTMADRLLALALPILGDLGLELYDFEYTGGVIRITIDKPGGLDLSDITDATRIMSRELDHADLIETAYSLEVSSPGLERNLRTPTHYQSAISSMVKVKLRAGQKDERRLEGRLVAADEATITLTIGGVNRLVGYDEIDKARTVFAWGGQPKPGKGSKIPRRDGAPDDEIHRDETARDATDRDETDRDAIGGNETGHEADEDAMIEEDA